MEYPVYCVVLQTLRIFSLSPKCIIYNRTKQLGNKFDEICDILCVHYLHACILCIIDVKMLQKGGLFRC